VRVRFARWFGVMLTVVGALIGVLGVAMAADDSGAAIPFLASALTVTIYGLLSFGPVSYVDVSGSQVRIAMTRGPYKRVHIGLNERLDTDGDRLLIVGDGGDVTRLPVYRSMANPADWASLVTSLGR
jgi:hypothetical protein